MIIKALSLRALEVCRRKVGYRTKARALRIASRGAAKFQIPKLHAYRCECCGRWHLTKFPRGLC